MKQIHMIREPDQHTINPKMDDVHTMMKLLSTDNGEPLIILRSDSLIKEDANSDELWIARMNEINIGSLAGWLIRYRSSDKQSFVLATNSPEQEIFQTYELFGVFESIRQECLVSASTIDSAIEWFLLEGSKNPDLIWLDFRACVRSL